MNDLDPAALDALAALADEGSFERAAQRLLVTQSAVSQRLRNLEGRLGRPLVVRSRPLRLTEAGKHLLRYARQWQALRADIARELGAGPASGTAPLRIAVNADSLATWVLPALDPLVQAGLLIELLVDDQDFTHDGLREGAVLGCVSTVREALRGCRVVPLGVMPYVAVASPGFVERRLPRGLRPEDLAQVPFLVFNRKDDMQALWVSAAFGLRQPRLQARYVPSSEAYVHAATMGWGIGVVPELQVRALLGAGRLVALAPQVAVPVALYWHEWRLDGEATGDAAAQRGGALARIGDALVQGARGALAAPPGRAGRRAAASGPRHAGA
ncbi:LysR family transcriptional regulator ArgP [Piscinibacter sakaiensis]|uniref:Chromosome initiation inhibitor n=1 Tax=Piscinibacter sakaiensis TaxID=1547922 RepID=A0A0K8P603_PISS1|nr:LysR family transcriptional regulator ArgP [Piscinibacter sakaiensis]GAP37625.1 chromosome initiation inhibitor [Piscinibacter sakaiensis]